MCIRDRHRTARVCAPGRRARRPTSRKRDARCAVCCRSHGMQLPVQLRPQPTGPTGADRAPWPWRCVHAAPSKSAGVRPPRVRREVLLELADARGAAPPWVPTNSPHRPSACRRASVRGAHGGVCRRGSARQGGCERSGRACVVAPKRPSAQAPKRPSAQAPNRCAPSARGGGKKRPFGLETKKRGPSSECSRSARRAL